MTYKKVNDGIAQRGKTKGKNYGNTGPTLADEKGPIKNTVGKTNADMRKMGRGMAKVANQKRG